MAEVDSQTAPSSKTAGTQWPGAKRVFMIHLDIERKKMQKPKNCRKKTPRVP
jgi:hypothetical protein